MLSEEKILGVKVNTNLTKESVISIIEKDMLSDGGTHLICTTNPEFIIDAQHDSEFKEIINKSDLSVPDGIGLVLALRYKSIMSKYSKESFLYPFRALLAGLTVAFTPFLSSDISKYRIDGVGLVDDICRLAPEKSWNVFFLGGWPKDTWGRNIITNEDMATLAAQKQLRKYPGLNVVGSTSQFSRNVSDDKSTVSFIRKCMHEKNVSHLDFMFVAYNHPYQEKWIIRNAKSIPASVCIGVGATLDYFSGNKSPSPEIITKYSVDWLYRLFTQPWRIKRIFKAFPLFPIKVFVETIRKSN